MKTKTRKNPSRSEYLKGCDAIKEFLPKGCRFLQVGEIVPEGAKCIFNDGEIFDALETFRRIMGRKLEDLDRDQADAIVADFIGYNCRKEDFVAYVKAAKKGLKV